jgi:hypothetical protein
MTEERIRGSRRVCSLALFPGYAVLFASLGALMVNPYGWRLVWNPIDMMLYQKLNIANGDEWQPLRLDWFVGRAALLAIGLMVLANCLRGRKWKFYEFAFVFFAWYAAFDHVRFTFLAAVITTPFLAADMKRSFCTQSDKRTIPAMNALALACAIAIAVRIFPGEVNLRKDAAILFPEQTISEIQPSWHTFNAANVGGVMAFSKSSYIDSRLDTFEHHGVLGDYIDTMRIKRPLELLDRYHIDHVLFPEHTPLVYLLERQSGWRSSGARARVTRPMCCWGESGRCYSINEGAADIRAAPIIRIALSELRARVLLHQGIYEASSILFLTVCIRSSLNKTQRFCSTVGSF